MTWIRATNIGDRIRDLREALNLTQIAFGQVAFGANVDKTDQTISDWENHKVRPLPKDLAKIAKHYKLDMEVFGEGGPMPSTMLGKPPSSPVAPRSPLGPGSGRPQRAADKAVAETWERIQREIGPYLTSGERLDPDQAMGWLIDMVRATKVTQRGGGG